MASKMLRQFSVNFVMHLMAVTSLAIPLSCIATDVTAPPYLAVGDGKTDDTTAFQGALTAVGGAGGGVVYVPVGKYVISSTLVIPNGTTLEGSGEGATTIESTVLGSPTLSLQGELTKVKNMSVHWSSSASPTAGTVGIYAIYGPSGSSYQAKDFELSHLYVTNFYDNIYINGSIDGIISDIYSTNAIHDGVVGLSAQGYWSNLDIVANEGDGVYLGVSTSGNGGVSPFMTGIQTYANGGWGVHTVNNIYLGGMPSFLNNDSQGELLIDGNPNGPAEDAGHVANVDIQYAGRNPFASVPGYTNVSNAPGVEVTAAAGPVRFTDISMFSNNGTGLLLNGGNIQVSNVRILGSGSNFFCVSSNGGQNEFTNVLCNTPSQISGNSTIVRGCHFTVGSVSQPALLISSGINMIVADNVIYSAGSSALSISSGVTLANASNVIIGPVSNAGSASGAYTTLFH